MFEICDHCAKKATPKMVKTDERIKKISDLSILQIKTNAAATTKFNTELKLEVSATKLLNNEFRALPGLPKIGRTATARLLLDL